MDFQDETERVVWASVYASWWATNISPTAWRASDSTRSVEFAVQQSNEAVLALRRHRARHGFDPSK